MFKIGLSDGLAIAGVVLAIVLIVLDKAGKLKGPMLLVMLAVAAILTLPLALNFEWISEAQGLAKFSRGLLMFFGVGFIYSLIAVWVSPGPTEPAPTPPPSAIVAKLSMTFINPANTQWRITNESDSIIARGVKYWFGLISLDQSLRQGNKPIDPVQIPVRTIDFINPKDSAGAIIFNRELGIKPGERFFGVATFNCPGCTEQSYWLYIQHEREGWFAKMQSSSRGLEIPMGAIALNPEFELEKLVPSSQRTPILDERRN